MLTGVLVALGPAIPLDTPSSLPIVLELGPTLAIGDPLGEGVWV